MYFLTEFIQVLENEIFAIRRRGQATTTITNGRQLNRVNGDYRYQFKVEYDLSFPADTPCKLIVGGKTFEVIVISYDGNFIIVSSNVELPDDLESATLESGAEILIEKLIECIRDNIRVENRVGSRMFLKNGSVYPYSKLYSYDDICFEEKNDENQNKAIVSAVSNDITYIWGPPGTGKTTVIGQIVYNLFRKNRSVLIVSHTNTAVDEAIVKAVKSYDKEHEESDNYPILRIGIPVKEEVPEKTLLDSHVEILGKELYAKRDELEKEKIEIQSIIAKCNQILAKDGWIKENNLEEIESYTQSVSEYENQIKKKNQEIEAVKKSIKQEKEKYPEYQEFLKWDEKVKEQTDLYDNAIKEIGRIHADIEDLKKNIRSANDEIKKHSEYEKIEKQEEKYMTADFLKNELALISPKIKVLNAEINELNDNEKRSLYTIEEYNKKNTLAKFLSGKRSVEQAQHNLKYIATRLPSANDELERCKKLENEYKEQLDEVLILREKKNTFAPTNTTGYWKLEVKSYKQKQEELEFKLPVSIEKKKKIESELNILKKHQEETRLPWDSVHSLEVEVDELKKIVTDLSEKKSDCEKTISKHLENEKLMCRNFLKFFDEEDESSLFSELSKLFSEIKKEIDSVDIEQKKQEINTNNELLQKIFGELNEINSKLQEVEKQAIFNAKIVGTTLTKSYLSKALRERKFDTVILDEASMASIPALWCASYLAEKNIVIAGDFLQLPPIVNAKNPVAEKWLEKDIFYHSGMQNLAREKQAPDNFVMLNKQFRMESDIADIANMYYGQYCELQSNDNHLDRIKMREDFYEWYSGDDRDSNVYLINTQNLNAWVTEVAGSRVNYLSALVCVELAFKFIDSKLCGLDKNNPQRVTEASVLIVAPFKPHVSKIKKLIELEYKKRGFKEELGFIRVGTVHSMQGSEADIVIFDFVVDEPNKNNILINPDGKVDLRKEFNVAITRAKFKLYLVGNFDYCLKYATKGNALSELLSKFSEKISTKELKVFMAEKVFHGLDIDGAEENVVDVNSSKVISCRGNYFDSYFNNDIRTFNNRMVIYSPFITESRLNILLPEFADRIRAGKQIVVVTKDIYDRDSRERSKYQEMKMRLEDIGVKVVPQKGMHEKLIFVDDDVFWIGSLNALSFSGKTGEFMMRHHDRELVDEIKKSYNIDKL